jgi:hypothetical protein
MHIRHGREEHRQELVWLAASGVVHEQESYTAALSDPPKE